MIRLRQPLAAAILALSVAAASHAGTISGSRSSMTSMQVGTITGSRTGTISGSRAGTISGSRTGTITGSNTDRSGSNVDFQETLIFRMTMLFIALGW